MSAAVSPPQQNLPVISRKDPDTGAIVDYPAYNGVAAGNSFVSRLYQPVNAISSIGSSVMQIDFQIQNQSEIHQFTDLVLQVTLAVGGTGGQHADLLGSYHLLQTYQEVINGAPVTTRYPNLMLAQALATHTAEQSATVLPMAGYPPTSAAFAPITVAGGNSINLLMPLAQFTFLTNGVLLPQTRSQLRLRFNFNTSNTWLASTSTVTAAQVSITQVQLFAQGIVYRPNELAAQTARWQQSTHLYPVTAPQFKQFQIGSINTTTISGKQTLNTVAGAYAGAICQFFDQDGATNETYLTPLALDLLQFYYNDGSQINFINSDQLIRYQDTTQFPFSPIWEVGSGGTGGYQSRDYFIPFVLSYNHALQMKGQSQGLIASGFESVSVTPSASATNGRLDVYMSQNCIWAVLPLSGIITFTPMVSQSS